MQHDQTVGTHECFVSGQKGLIAVEVTAYRHALASARCGGTQPGMEFTLFAIIDANNSVQLTSTGTKTARAHGIDHRAAQDIEGDGY